MFLGRGVSATTPPRMSPKTWATKLDMILDGGPTPLGLESTVIGFHAGKPVLLRPGAIPRQEIEAVVGALGEAAGETIQSPGQLAGVIMRRAQRCA